MENQKKTWEKPQLIILARGTPEENVLTHCKYIGAVVTGPLGTVQTSCNDPNAQQCQNCQSRSGS